MGILIGNISANPNTLHAALAHYEAGHLDAFCIPWLPSASLINGLRHFPGLNRATTRLERRVFPPLDKAPRIENLCGEGVRLLKRMFNREPEEHLDNKTGKWLSKTLVQQCQHEEATAVHVYEDFALDVFARCRQLGKPCIYDMPTCYFHRKITIFKELAGAYPEWLPTKWPVIFSEERLKPKSSEMALADVVLAPSTFAAKTILESFPEKSIALAPYGVDSIFWKPSADKNWGGPLRFVFVGQIAVAKGIPVLLEAWRRVELKEARLDLVGIWAADECRKRDLPANVHYHGHQPRENILRLLQQAHVFVFPSFFEGLSLALLEAMGCGLPALTTYNSGGADFIHDDCGWLYEPADVDRLAELFRRIANEREKLPQMGLASRQYAEKQTWTNYRQHVRKACSRFY